MQDTYWSTGDQQQKTTYDLVKCLKYRHVFTVQSSALLDVQSLSTSFGLIHGIGKFPGLQILEVSFGYSLL